MESILFSYPNCVKCEEAKKYLKANSIRYEEVNSGIGEGRKKFREFYIQNKEKIEREKDGTITLPIFVKDGKIIQGMEKILQGGL